MSESQKSLIMDVHPSVVSAWKSFDSVSKTLEKARLKREKLMANLTQLNDELAAYEQAFDQLGRQYVLNCCLTLERCLQEVGRGWCPICQEVVDFEGLSFARTSTTVHHPERSGDHGYYGGTSAYVERIYTFWRVPHRRHGCCELPPSRSREGGSVADAPVELYDQFGIPRPDEAKWEQFQPLLWQFVA